MTELRRNMIVLRKSDDYIPFIPYGRVNRILPNGMIEVVDPDEFYIIEPENLKIVDDYFGRWELIKPTLDHIYAGVYEYRWIPMPTLRKLKQKAAYRNKHVWKKHRKYGSWPSESEIVEHRLRNPNQQHIQFYWEKEGA